MALDEDDPTIEDEGWEDQLTQLLRRIRLNVRFRRGRSIFDEVVYGAKRALLSGEFRTGQFFPSVRDLAKELKIHRNTAHQIVKYLAENDWLETCPRCLTTITKVARSPRRKAINAASGPTLLAGSATRMGLGRSGSRRRTAWEDRERA